MLCCVVLCCVVLCCVVLCCVVLCCVVLCCVVLCCVVLCCRVIPCFILVFFVVSFCVVFFGFLCCHGVDKGGGTFHLCVGPVLTQHGTPQGMKVGIGLRKGGYSYRDFRGTPHTSHRNATVGMAPGQISLRARESILHMNTECKKKTWKNLNGGIKQ